MADRMLPLQQTVSLPLYRVAMPHATFIRKSHAIRYRRIARIAAVDIEREGNNNNHLVNGKELPASLAPSELQPATQTPGPDLQSDIESLRQMVKQQSVILNEQQETIHLLRNYMENGNGAAPMITQLTQEDEVARQRMRDAQLTDRRLVGMFDARYHSTS